MRTFLWEVVCNFCAVCGDVVFVSELTNNLSFEHHGRYDK